MIEKLRMVEVEINSYCNRKCPWCPNNTFSRSHPISMPSMMYIKMLHELRDGNFNGTISFSRNNEPFFDFELLQSFIKYGKIILPNVRYVTNTNGDFLTKEKIITSGIQELSIMDYDCKGMEKCTQQLLDWGAIIETIINNVIYADLEDVKIAYCVDWPKNTVLEDKGGFLKKEGRLQTAEFRANLGLRNYPCIDPGIFLAIDFNGDVMPCCQMRHDNPAHEKFILGNIGTETIEEIFSKEKSQKLFAQINTETGIKLPLPCQHCHKGIGRYTRDNPSIYFSERYRKGEGAECQ